MTPLQLSMNDNDLIIGRNSPAQKSRLCENMDYNASMQGISHRPFDRRLKWPASRLFTKPFVQAKLKENTKAPRHWSLWGNSPVTGEFPAPGGSNAENVSIWWRHHLCRKHVSVMNTWLNYMGHAYAHVTFYIIEIAYPRCDNSVLLITSNCELFWQYAFT